MLGSSGYEFLADATVLIHALFVLFVAGGQLLILVGWVSGWAWTRNLVFRIAHLAAIGFVVLETWLGIVCPLSILENNFRGLAGAAKYEMSFIGYWLNRLLFFSFPAWVFTLIYSIFFLWVVVTFFAYPPKWRRAA
jgi:polyferredoxin